VLQTDVRGGFPREGAEPGQRSCDFGVGPQAGGGRLTVLADVGVSPDQVELIARRFADGQPVAVGGDRARYRTDGAGAELVVVTPSRAVGVVRTGATGAGDLEAQLVQLAQRALAAS
jgi:hypothetical protein